MIKYPSYKSSGIEWIGDVPKNWDTIRLKYLVAYNIDSLPETTDEGYELKYVEISDVEFGNGIINQTPMLFKDAPSRARRRVQNGDIIVSTVRTYLKAIARVDSPPENLVVSTGFAVIHPIVIESGYCGYLFNSEHLIGEIISRSTGVSYPAINSSELVDIAIPVPPPREQHAIADYLDEKTKLIDNTIAKKRQLIQLLKEERTAMINQAVTRGLDPNVELKPSGIEWLGEVPEHWEVKKLSLVADLTRLAGYEYTAYWRPSENGEIVALRGFNIGNNKLQKLDNVERISEELSQRLNRSRLYINDIVFPCVGTIGNAYLVTENDKYHINQNIAKISPTFEADPAFLLYFLLSDICQYQVFYYNTSDAQPSVLVGNLRKFKVPCPPVKEQRFISNYIKEQNSIIEKSITDIHQQIELIKEYRNTLINEVVTGKVCIL